MSKYNFDHTKCNICESFGGEAGLTKEDIDKVLYPLLTAYLNHETQSECAEFLVKKIEEGDIPLLIFVTHMLTDAVISGVMMGKLECPEIYKEKLASFFEKKKGAGGDVFISPEMLGKMHTIH